MTDETHTLVGHIVTAWLRTHGEPVLKRRRVAKAVAKWRSLLDSFKSVQMPANEMVDASRA